MKFSKLLKIAMLAVLALGLSSAYVRAFTVAGPSMSPTPLKGDFILSNHAAYDLRLPYTAKVVYITGAPEKGDLIMYFDIPQNAIAIKRIIGVPGDAVRMENNVLYVNGIEAVQHDIPAHVFNGVSAEYGLGQLVKVEVLGNSEHLITYTPEKSPVHSFEKVKVAEGKYFILGDHRDNSEDSRYIGLIYREQIKGRIFKGTRTLDSYAGL